MSSRLTILARLSVVLTRSHAMRMPDPADLKVIIVSLGSTGGVSELPFGVFGDFMSRYLKSKDLFVPKYWKEANLGWPPT
jgi:hypothetical protein